MSNHSIFNDELMKMATGLIMPPTQKSAFVPPGAMDPAAAGGGGGMPPGGGAGGMPPGAPPMPPADPSMMGGPPPPPPPGGDPMAAGGLPPELMAMVQAEVQKAMGGGAGGGAMGGAGGAMGGGMKPKIDVNVEMMQIKNMMAKLMDTLNVQMPVQDMVATPEKLEAMAGGGDTAMAGAEGGAEGGAGGAIGQLDPMAGMDPAGQPGPPKMALASAGMGQLTNQAQALSMVLSQVNGR